MKNFCSFLVLLSFILSVFSSWGIIYATETTDNAQTAIEASDIDSSSTSFTCVYDADTDSVVLNGTVAYDVLVKHNDYTINVYSIGIGQNLDDILKNESIEPLASSAIAIKFKFIVKVDSIEKRFIRYAIVFVDPDGNKFIASTPQYPQVESDMDYEYGEKTHFKGIETNNSTLINDSEAGSVIINVNPSKMFGGSTNGYIYPMSNSYIYINKSYIQELDIKIRNAYACGARVYLRYLLPAGNSTLSNNTAEDPNALYEMPDLYSADNIEYMSAFSRFLTERSSSRANGKIHGFILGTMVDYETLYNNVGRKLSAENYAEILSLYISTVGNSARLADPTIDIVLPLSKNNDYNKEVSFVSSYSPSLLLKNIISHLNKGFSDGYDFSVMIETSSTALGITDKNFENISLDTPAGDTSLHVDNISILSSYLETLDDAYGNAPSNIMYLWSVPEGISGNALTTAYSYSYYTLLGNDAVSSFIVSFSSHNTEKESALVKDIGHIFKYIDTHLGFEYTKNSLVYFGAENWSDVVTNMYTKDFALRTIYEYEASHNSPNDIVGSFIYYDFSESSDQKLWNISENCQYISSGYTAKGDKALKINISPVDQNGYSDAIMINKYPENMIYTPHLSFKLGIDGEKVTDDMIFEVQIKFGTSNCSTTLKGMLSGNSESVFFVSASDFVTNNLTDYIRISVRCITNDVENFNLWVHNVTGYSESYSSPELEALINAERMDVRDLNEEETENNNNRFILGIVLFSVIIVTVGAALFAVFKKHDDGNENET